MVLQESKVPEMQNLENTAFQGNRDGGLRRIQDQGQPELLFQRHENRVAGNGGKFPTLVIEDETKNYVDGIEDSSDGEPDPKVPRGSHDAVMRQKKTRGRVKIKMEFIENKLRRYTTFSKRKTGIMKKVCFEMNAAGLVDINLML